MVKVRSCCCIANLRTGTLVIGIADFIIALTTFILTTMAAVNYESYRTWWDGSEWWENHPMDDLQGLYITMAVVSCILMTLDLMLLIGVSQSKPKLILPWIVYAYVSALSNFACAVTYGVYSIEYYYDYYGYISVSWSVVYLVLKIYFLLVVWSLYKEMRGTAGDNALNVTVYPQPYPNGPQNYPNQQPSYPNGQMQYPNQPPMYPNGQMQYPNQQQPYPQPLQPMGNMSRNG